MNVPFRRMKVSHLTLELFLKNLSFRYKSDYNRAQQKFKVQLLCNTFYRAQFCFLGKVAFVLYSTHSPTPYSLETMPAHPTPSDHIFLRIFQMFSLELRIATDLVEKESYRTMRIYNFLKKFWNYLFCSKKTKLFQDFNVVFLTKRSKQSFYMISWDLKSSENTSPKLGN